MKLKNMTVKQKCAEKLMVENIVNIGVCNVLLFQKLLRKGSGQRCARAY